MNERIKQLRKDLKMTQETFASKIAITRQYLSLLESNERVPSDLVLNAICQTFGVRREWLEYGDGPMYQDADPDSSAVLVPELVSVLEDHPALLDLMKKVVRHFKPSDWDRLNQIIDEAQKEEQL